MLRCGAYNSINSNIPSGEESLNSYWTIKIIIFQLRDDI